MQRHQSKNKNFNILNTKRTDSENSALIKHLFPQKRNAVQSSMINIFYSYLFSSSVTRIESAPCKGNLVTP